MSALQVKDWKLDAQAVVQLCRKKCDKYVSLSVLSIRNAKKTYQFKTHCNGDIHSKLHMSFCRTPDKTCERRYKQNHIQIQVHGCWLKQLMSLNLNTK